MCNTVSLSETGTFPTPPLVGIKSRFQNTTRMSLVSLLASATLQFPTRVCFLLHLLGLSLCMNLICPWLKPLEAFLLFPNGVWIRPQQYCTGIFLSNAPANKASNVARLLKDCITKSMDMDKVRVLITC